MASLPGRVWERSLKQIGPVLGDPQRPPDPEDPYEVLSLDMGVIGSPLALVGLTGLFPEPSERGALPEPGRSPYLSYTPADRSFGDSELGSLRLCLRMLRTVMERQFGVAIPESR